MRGEPSTTESPVERHRQETAFFDSVAVRGRASLAPLRQQVMERYRHASVASARFPLEYALALVRCPEAPRVLDVGCGDGTNAVLMAALGARVTGFDISPESIATAQDRAALNGVGNRARFLVGTAEAFDPAEPPYDVVWCEAVLHHVIPDLPRVLARLRRWQRPGGRTVMIEPVSLSPGLRRLRSFVPLHTESTPDERPLRRPELEMIAEAYPDLIIRHFRTLGRLDQVILHDTILEVASSWRRGTMRMLAGADHALNRTSLRRFASVAVMHTRP